ncbi:hypothetical protein OKW96_13280 [Sphingobacterium sp. KU25419]|nr:hypothetical protein OKW96_13280 [Sphingobacterium sp. KU25419]
MLKYGEDVLKRYNVRGKADFQVNDWLSFGNNTLLTIRDFNSPVFMDGDFFWNVNRTSSLDVPKNPDGSWTSAGAGLLGRMQEGGRTTRNINEFQTTFNAKAVIIKIFGISMLMLHCGVQVEILIHTMYQFLIKLDLRQRLNMPVRRPHMQVKAMIITDMMLSIFIQILIKHLEIII